MHDIWRLLLCLSAAGPALTAEPSRPRGVGPEFAKHFKSPNTFNCISNPSIKLDFSQVNDDYCDCPDGSDEPGTSACAHLINTKPGSQSGANEVNYSQALPGYYCKNKGHAPSYIPFTNVNDGICDHELCCDGSDEWEGVGEVKCENKCKEIGKERKKLDDLWKKSMGAASKRRKELVLEADRLKKQVEEKIGVLEVESQGADLRVAGLERTLAEVERREKGKVVRGPSKGSRTNVLASLARSRVEELRESLVEVRQQRDNARSTMQELEGILSKFKDEYNPNFNDEGVKRAVKAWENYAADKAALGGEDTAALDRDLDEISREDGEEHGIKWSEWEGEDESDIDVLYRFEEYFPKPVRDWIDQKLRDLRVILVENGILADNGSQGESKLVTDARNALDAAKSDLDSKRTELTNLREDLQRDYGADDVFRALKGTCLEKEAGEYIYELCWMDRTTQKAQNGGGHTGLGNFVRLDTVTVDEDVPADGKGLGSGVRVALQFENGQQCWNGPMRSTTVILACAEHDEIWKVVEAEKCVYRMEVGSPVVCGAGDPAKAATRGVRKDEL